MNTLKQLREMIEGMERDLGIVGDFIGVICLFGIAIGLFVFVPLMFG